MSSNFVIFFTKLIKLLNSGLWSRKNPAQEISTSKLLGAAAEHQKYTAQVVRIAYGTNSL